MDILLYPDARLKEVSSEVESIDEQIVEFIRLLENTRQAGPGAVGIAAPQVAMQKRIVIVDVSNMRKPIDNHGHMIMVNPEIIKWEGMVKGREGCLSVPDFTGNVIRAEKIVCRYTDEQGTAHEIESTGSGFVLVLASLSLRQWHGRFCIIENLKAQKQLISMKALRLK